MNKIKKSAGSLDFKLSLERLESRIAPAAVTISADHKTATWTDVDGDAVTLKVTKPILDPSGAQFTFLPQAGGDVGFQLALLDLTGVGTAGQGTSLTFSAKRDVAEHHGDGAVNVGRIDATGLDLGAITVAGDLASVTAGDNVITTSAVTSITVHSAGAFGTDTQGAQLAAQPTFIDWEFTGKIGNVTIKGDDHVALDVQDTDGIVDGNNSITIGNVTIGGNLIGGNESQTGFAGVGSGYVFSEGSIGKVKIGGDILGGSSQYGGQVATYAAGIQKVTVGGDIIGGSASFTGAIQVSSLGSLTVGGSIVGGTYSDSGEIRVYGPLGKITVGGSVIGGDTPRDDMGQVPVDQDGNPIFNSDAGSIRANSIGAVTIFGNLQTGEGNFSGAIHTDGGSVGNIGSITIKNAFRGNAFVGDNGHTYRVDNNGIYADAKLGPVTIGAIEGGDPLAPLDIIAQGKSRPTNATDSLAIAKITVARDARNVEILAGFFNDFTATNPDVQIGAVRIGNSFSGSISAGVVAGTRGYGDAGGALTAPDVGDGFTDNPAIHSKIASITVGTYVVGNPWHDAGFVNGITAQEIGAMKIGRTALELTPNTATSTPDAFVLGTTGEFFVTEVM